MQLIKSVHSTNRELVYRSKEYVIYVIIESNQIYGFVRYNQHEPRN